MKRILSVALALTLMNGAAIAAGYPNGPGPGGYPNNGQYPNNQTPNNQGPQNQNPNNRDPQAPNNQGSGQSNPRWSRGDRVPDQYRGGQYEVTDWRQRGLSGPPRGYHWVTNGNGDYFLAANTTGVIRQTVYRDDRDQRWKRRYQRTYTYDDDGYYQQCRNGPDPAGVIAGGIIGALLGQMAGNGRGGASIAGIIIGSTLGAALTKNLDCEDRSYAYKTYYTGLNAGRANRTYSWNNPHSGHRGNFRVGKYYNDQDSFRCANYTQTVYIQKRSQNASGSACRQADGSWVFVR